MTIRTDCMDSATHREMIDDAVYRFEAAVREATEVRARGALGLAEPRWFHSSPGPG